VMWGYSPEVTKLKKSIPLLKDLKGLFPVEWMPNACYITNILLRSGEWLHFGGKTQTKSRLIIIVHLKTEVRVSRDQNSCK
jgi:hypothetical protein